MSAEGAVLIEGVVLCRVGDDRLAVRAREVTAFEIADGTGLYAGVGFDPRAVTPHDARLLRAAGGGLVVDSVEVHAEQVRWLPVPGVLARAWGGALSGFIEAGGALWPLVSLERLPRVEVAP